MIVSEIGMVLARTTDVDRSHLEIKTTVGGCLRANMRQASRDHETRTVGSIDSTR